LSAAATEIPYDMEPHPLTRMYNGKFGIWLFLASEIMHSPRFLLIDQKGRLRGYYEGVTDQEIEARFNGQIVDAPMNPDKMESLLKDVMTLLREETRRR